MGTHSINMEMNLGPLNFKQGQLSPRWNHPRSLWRNSKPPTSIHVFFIRASFIPDGMRYLFLALRMLELRPKLDQFRRCGIASIVGGSPSVGGGDVQAVLDEQTGGSCQMGRGPESPLWFVEWTQTHWIWIRVDHAWVPFATCATAAQAMKLATLCIHWSLLYRTCWMSFYFGILQSRNKIDTYNRYIYIHVYMYPAEAFVLALAPCWSIEA